MNAPVGASALMVHCWLGSPIAQLLMAIAVPLARLLPLPTRSMHLVVSSVRAMCQLAPSGTSVNRCGAPPHEAYCCTHVPLSVEPLQTSSAWLFDVVSGETR